MSTIPDNSQGKRSHPRYKADGLGIHSKMILASYLKIVDVSMGGMALEADRRLNIGKKYSLKIKIQGVLTTVKGVVVWCSLIKNTKNTKGEIIPIYKCGIRFTDVESVEIQKIIDSVQIQKKEIDVESEKEYVDLGSDFIKGKEKEKLEDFVSSLYK